MTQTPAARGRRGTDAGARRAESETTALKPIPLAPQRKLVVVVMIVLAAWIVALLVMFFTTVAR